MSYQSLYITDSTWCLLTKSEAEQLPKYSIDRDNNDAESIENLVIAHSLFEPAYESDFTIWDQQTIDFLENMETYENEIRDDIEYNFNLYQQLSNTVWNYIYDNFIPMKHMSKQEFCEAFLPGMELAKKYQL